MENDLTEFALREQAGKPAPAADIPAEWKDRPIKPLHWRMPSTDSFSPAGRAQLKAIRKATPKIDGIWLLLNGRRTAQEICERSGCLPEAAIAFLELLLKEGKIEEGL